MRLATRRRLGSAMYSGWRRGMHCPRRSRLRRRSATRRRRPRSRSLRRAAGFGSTRERRSSDPRRHAGCRGRLRGSPCAAHAGAAESMELRAAAGGELNTSLDAASSVPAGLLRRPLAGCRKRAVARFQTLISRADALAAPWRPRSRTAASSSGRWRAAEKLKLDGNDALRQLAEIRSQADLARTLLGEDLLAAAEKADVVRPAPRTPRGVLSTSERRSMLSRRGSRRSARTPRSRRGVRSGSGLARLICAGAAREELAGAGGVDRCSGSVRGADRRRRPGAHRGGGACAVPRPPRRSRSSTRGPRWWRRPRACVRWSWNSPPSIVRASARDARRGHPQGRDARGFVRYQGERRFRAGTGGAARGSSAGAWARRAGSGGAARTSWRSLRRARTLDPGLSRRGSRRCSRDASRNPADCSRPT